MSLEQLRLRAAGVVTLCIVIFAGIIVAGEWFMQGSLGLATIVALPSMAVLLGLYVFMRSSQSFRYAVVSVLMAEVMALLIAARGNPWQIDMHMAFFAALALSALLYDVRAIILGTALVALHHLGLGLSLDNLVFYGGGSSERVLLHAAILVVEGGGLAWLTVNTQALLGFASAKSDEVAREVERSQQLSAAAEAERTRRTDGRALMLGRLETSFGEVVAAAAKGEFSMRVETDFDDEVLNSLGRGINAMIDTVDRGIGETGGVLAAIARADLTHRVEGQYQGAFERLKTDTNEVAERLTEIVVNLQTTSKGVKVATSEIAGGASDLSDRTSKQAATIEETSAAMEQLAATVQKNAERARNASTNAVQVTQAADQGGEVMHRATDAMERISASSSKVYNIIGLIDDIAFQTNLLALNASVEAARAGEAGKGFAVVAVEVRRLAQSAAQASKEIKVLIDQSAEEVKTGSQLVEQAAGRLSAMLDAARANNQLLESIARDSREQASAIDEVNISVRLLDEVTQHNAALVEETNAAIAQTDSQAGELDRIVGLFSIDKSIAPAPAVEPVRRAPKAPPVEIGVRELQRQVRSAARTYLSRDNTALADEWSEF